MSTRALPLRHKFDVDAYYRMAEAGVLQPGERIELIDGEIIQMAPIGSRHADTTNRLMQLLVRSLDAATVYVACQTPLRLDAHNEPQPDLMLLRPRAAGYASSHPTPAEAFLVIEVAESSLSFDRTTKAALYATFGVRELWIIDPNTHSIELCRDPKGSEYLSRSIQSSGTLSPVEGVSIDVENLFT